jgi:hypothetical protein
VGRIVLIGVSAARAVPLYSFPGRSLSEVVMTKPNPLDISDFLDMNEPEVEEEFLRFIQTSIGTIEAMDMSVVPFRGFARIEQACEELIKELANYEKRIGYEFDSFRDFEKRIKKQLNRADRMKFKAGYREQPPI